MAVMELAWASDLFTERSIATYRFGRKAQKALQTWEEHRPNHAAFLKAMDSHMRGATQKADVNPIGLAIIIAVISAVAVAGWWLLKLI